MQQWDSTPRYLSIIWAPVGVYLYVCVHPCMLVSSYWPLTLAMTVPAAPRMSTEFRVWCLPMTALRTRSNSAKRSCTISWRSSRFSRQRRWGTNRLSHVSIKTMTRLTNASLNPKLACTVRNHTFSSHQSKSPPSHHTVSHRWASDKWIPGVPFRLCHTRYLANTLSFWTYETLLSPFI